MRSALTVRIKRNPDGGTSLTCTRADSTVTWHRHKGDQAAFFPRHDLTHYAAETVLTRLQGFYSLVAAGWDLSDFGTPWPRGRIPPEAESVEAIVGFLDLERASGKIPDVDDLNDYIASRCAEHGHAAHPLITADELQLIRRRRGELFAKWDALPPGEALELSFP